MSLLALAALLTGVFELVWRLSPPLQPYRWHFRAMLAVFWATALLIHFVDVWGLAPGLYFNGTPRYASDAATYQGQAARVADGLRHGSLIPLLDTQILNYPRLLGLIYYVVGNHPLAGGLFNAVFFMTSAVSIFLIGRAMFDERVGLAAAWMVACWPSFLLYGTQTMRWTATTAGLHLVILAIVLATSRTTFHRVVLTGLLGYSFLLGDQPYLARVLYVSIAVYAGYLLVLAARAVRWRAPFIRVAVLGLAMYVSYGSLWLRFFQPAVHYTTVAEDEASKSGGPEISMPSRPSQPDTLWGWLEFRLDNAVAPLLYTRYAFISTQQELDQTGIVDGTPLHAKPIFTFREFVANLPQAVYWAVFQPTPAALLHAGRGASGVRAYALVEVLLYYALLPLVAAGAALGLVSGPANRVRVLVVFFICAFAYVLFGSIATNGGTLHRYRQPFVLLQMVFAAAAARHWLEPWVRSAISRTRFGTAATG